MLFKFILLWCLMTAISTVMIQSSIAFFSADNWYLIVFIKLVVEALLVVMSFSLQKFVVYK